MEANEEKRKEYKETIKDIPLKNLVYIDESGIEMTIVKERGWGRRNQKLPGKKSGIRKGYRLQRSLIHAVSAATAPKHVG